MLKGNKRRPDRTPSIGPELQLGERGEYAVVKVGGSVLKDLSGYRRAVEMVRSLQERYRQVVVTVSAQKGDTDALVRGAEELGLEGREREEFLLIGEMNSAERLANMLDCPAYTQDREDYPLLGREVDGEMEPLLECEPRLLDDLCRHSTCVAAAFGPREKGGKGRTYERGGSDTLAAQAARAISDHTGKTVDAYFVKGSGQIWEPATGERIEKIYLRSLEARVMSGEIEQVVQRNRHFFEMLRKMNHGSRVYFVDEGLQVGTEILLPYQQALNT